MGRVQSFAVTLIGFVFAAAGAFMVGGAETPDDWLMGLMVTLFFGACGLVGLSFLLPARMPEPGLDGRIVIAPSRLRAALFALGGLAFIFAGVMILIQIQATGITPKLALGALGVPFGAIVLFVAGRQALAPKPIYILDHKGVECLQGMKWQLAWEDISNIGIGRVNNSSWLALETQPGVPDPAGRMAGINRRFGMPPYAIAPGTSGIAFQPLADKVIELWHAGSKRSARR